MKHVVATTRNTPSCTPPFNGRGPCTYLYWQPQQKLGLGQLGLAALHCALLRG